MTSVVFFDRDYWTDSQAINRIYYSTKAEELYVEFHNGTVAGYAGVTPTDFSDFVDAPSAGRHFASYIKGNYTGISGDVNLHFRPLPEVTPVEPVPAINTSNSFTSDGATYARIQLGVKSFSVRVDVNGVLEFNLDAEGFSEAETFVKNILEKALVGGDYVVRSVTSNA